MAQFLKAKFLSEALKWKAIPSHAADQFFAGLRYDPFIFQQARLTFPAYNQRFPFPADKEFAENFAKDLTNPTRNQGLLKIINPEILTPELEAANSQFETSARLEQQSLAQASGQPIVQPFLLTVSPAPAILKPMPATMAIKAEAFKEAITTPTPTPTQTPSTQAPPTIPSQPQSKIGKAAIQAPRMPTSIMNAARNLGSRAGVFFQRNVGKYLTAGRIATVVSGGIGAITGAALTQGNIIGIAGGGGLGAAAPSWIRSGEGTKFLGKLGNGAVNAGAKISSQASLGASRLSVSSASKKWALALIGLLIILVLFSGLTGGLTGTTPSQSPPPAPSGNGDLSSCKFTRAGNSQLIKSSILQGWITSAAASAQVPAQILASIAMHESQDFAANADDNHDAIKSGQYCNPGIVFCEDGHGNVLHSIPGQNDFCTSEEIANGARNAQAMGLMQLLDIYHPGQNLCSITNSLAIAAQKLQDSGITLQPTQDQVTKAIHQYYNSCTYGSYSYCDEVWQDLQSCQIQSSAGSGGNGGGGGGPTNFVFYCQGNTAWQQCQLGQGGCGPTSLAMILSSFGVNMDPTQVDQIFQSNDWRSCSTVGSELLSAIQSPWFKNLGFDIGPDLTVGTSLNISEAKKFLDEGYLIIGSSREYPIVKCAAGPNCLADHIFVVDSADLNSNTVDIRDPNNCSYADGNDEIQANRTRSITLFPWLYAYPVKKVR